MKPCGLLLLLLICFILTACSSNKTEESLSTPLPAVSVYAILVKDITNPYMVRMYEGFSDACDELGVQALLTGPEGSVDSNQSNIARDLIRKDVTAIAVAANDKDELADALNEVIAAGIPVVSLDSPVSSEERVVHIQQASPEMIGRVLIQACAQMMQNQGQFAILSTSEAMPNQASWVNWMELEFTTNSEKYKAMELVEIEYGIDEYQASVQATLSLIERYPNLKLIVAPTVVGIRAAAETVEKSGLPILITGLGLPSDMERYITNGICPWMYLWNPTDVGYLAAYAADAVVKGELTGVVGEILNSGKLGDKVVTKCEDGGTEVVLGNPKMFDSTNIMVWKEVF